MTNLAYRYEDERPTEMLDGVIYMMATPLLKHVSISVSIIHIFKRYLKGKKCRVFGDNAKVFLSEDDRVVPDVSLVFNKDILKENGIYGAPDLIVEILSPSTATHDKGYKKDLYERCGVKEYWIVDANSFSIEVYWLENGRYALHRVFTIPPKNATDGMTEQEAADYLAKLPQQFKTSLFDDLTIDLEEVFEDVRGW